MRGAVLLVQPGADRGVVAGGQAEGLEGQLAAQLVGEADLTLLELVEHTPVVGRIGDDADETVVLGGGAHHARPADVDLLDRVGARHALLGDGLLEGIEVHDDQVDRRDVVALHGFDVARLVTQGEDAAVHLGVQGLDATVHHLGEARVGRDLGHGDAGLGEGAVGAAGGEELDAHLGQGAGEALESGLVRDADERAVNALGHVLTPAHPGLKDGVEVTPTVGGETRIVAAQQPVSSRPGRPRSSSGTSRPTSR